jgi:ribonucleoside-diphosphate reductase alpha chain
MGLKFQRLFTSADVNPFDEVTWIKRQVEIKDETEKVLFQDQVEFPDFYSETACKIVASKYFKGHGENREKSLQQLIWRVVNVIDRWGQLGSYWENSSHEDMSAFRDELTYILLHQMASFNSPVWFNLGRPDRKQAVSACYINSVEDNLESILDLTKTEGMLFKDGSGSGVNLSPLRGRGALLAPGGSSSGSVSFMRALDAVAGAVKSGGTTRRAALMRVLNAEHPDIEEFIFCKMKAELAAQALIKGGFSADFTKDWNAYDIVPFQNANNSVRVKEDWMYEATFPGEWTHQKMVLSQIAEAAWMCGDPGMQFDTTINKWHTCPNSGRINASNPCSEYMFLDDSACNLASINLIKFLNEDGTFKVAEFKHVVDIMITAMEILVERAEYPTEKIKQNSLDFRPLGLGYANLGALLMSKGLAYDSDEGRAYAAAITSLMGGEAYCQSARIAEVKGPFKGFAKNREEMLNVVWMHSKQDHLFDLVDDMDEELSVAASDVLNTAWMTGQKYGFRNSQVTVLAPTGTIAFMMDCDTTGIEPCLSLIQYKKLVGGGNLKIINTTTWQALKNITDNEADRAKLHTCILDNGYITPEIAQTCGLSETTLKIFDTSLAPTPGGRCIPWEAHIKMMAAVQPFLSGAISKTVNMPHESTIDDIKKAYIMSWRMGLKAVAVYRDGCKGSQPLSIKKEEPQPSYHLTKDGVKEIPAYNTQEMLDTLEKWKSENEELANSRVEKCATCGHTNLIPAGTCKRCDNCGNTTGGCS